MAFSSSSLTFPQLSFKIDCSKLNVQSQLSVVRNQQLSFAFRGNRTVLPDHQITSVGAISNGDRSFIGGSRLTKPVLRRKASTVQASWLTNAQIASSVFTLGTVAVLPFYTLMVVAPNAELTRKSMESSTPYIVLGLLYAYLLYLSWTPDTIRYMFASKYMLPELPGIAKMFSSEMTLASAWIHLLGIDLFAARQVFHDGIQNKIETRHSVSLCLLFCPVGVLTHFITKALTASSKHNM